MVTKTKTKAVKIHDAVAHLSVLVMSAAAVMGMFELPEQSHNKLVVLPMQPALATVAPGGEPFSGDNAIRREREEVHPQHGSYGVSQRTPGRTGKL